MSRNEPVRVGDLSEDDWFYWKRHHWQITEKTSEHVIGSGVGGEVYVKLDEMVRRFGEPEQIDDADVVKGIVEADAKYAW